MASIVHTLGSWRFGRRVRPVEQQTDVVTTVEQAARLAPQWGQIEARRAGSHGAHLPQLPDLHL